MERWRINLYVLWVSQVISLMSFGFGLPFLPFFIQELGVSDPEALKVYAGILSLAPAATMAIMSPVWGVLSDRFGQKLMIQRAMFAAIFVIGGMGFATEVWHLLVLRFAQGLFTGTITASSTFVAVDTPNHKLSYALGVLSSSTFVGYSLGPLIGGKVAEAFGYRISFYVGALLMLVGFILVTVMVKPSPEMKARRANRQGRRSIIRGEKNWKQIASGGILLLMLMLFLQRAARSVFSPYLPLYIQELTGTTEGAADLTGTISGLVGFVSAASAIAVSRFADRFSKTGMMMGMLGAGVASMVLLMSLPPGLKVFFVFYPLIFLMIGGIEPLVTAATAEMVPPEHRGALFGIQGLVGSVGWLISPGIGIFLSVRYGTASIFAAMVACLVLNMGAVFLLMRKQKRRDDEGCQSENSTVSTSEPRV